MTTKFQQRHYEAVALILKSHKPGYQDAPGFSLWQDMVMAFIQAFKADNPKFLPDRFRKAAGQNA